MKENVFPPLGILYLASYLKRYGLRVQCLDMGLGNKLYRIKSNNVGVSFTSPQKAQAFEIAKKLRSKGKRLIAGGPHPTHAPDECKRYFDAVIRGYGEWGLMNQLTGMSHPPPDTINSYPFPDRDALPIRDYSYEIDGVSATVLMSSRGCPYNCAFCARVANYFEMQSGERTFHEIIHVNQTYGFRAFMFYDDCFIVSKKRLAWLSEMLKPLKFKFRSFVNSVLIDEDICELMKDMGMVECGIGVESGSDEVLKRNRKTGTREVNTRAVELLHKFGIRAKAFLIVGLPGETKETVDQTESWIKEAKPDDIDISVFQALPGSSIYNDPEAFGIRLDESDVGWYKGTPGKYKASASTLFLTKEEITEIRDQLESAYKDKSLLR